MHMPRQPHLSWRSLLRSSFSLLLVLAIALSSFITPVHATGVWEIPQPTEEEPLFVFDEGNVLSPATEGRLSQAAEKLFSATGFEVHLMTIQRLDYGDTAPGLAQEILDDWYPEVEDQADQALLIVDTLTNTAGLQLGANLKAVVSDEIATSIVQENLAYPLGQNRYNQALLDSGNRLISILAGKPDPGAPQITDNVATAEGTFATAEETDAIRTSSTVWVVILLVAATVIPMGTYYLYQYLQSRV